MLEIEKLLQEKNIAYRLIPLSGKAISHEDVIKHAREADPEDDCKTILTKDKKGNKYALFLRGMMKVDFGKVREVVGEKLSIVSYDDLKKSTGKEPGAVTPLLLEKTEIFVDKRVLEREKIHFSSGDHRYGLEISSADLDKVLKFKVADIVK